MLRPVPSELLMYTHLLTSEGWTAGLDSPHLIIVMLNLTEDGFVSPLQYIYI